MERKDGLMKGQMGNIGKRSGPRDRGLKRFGLMISAKKAESIIAPEQARSPVNTTVRRIKMRYVMLLLFLCLTLLGCARFSQTDQGGIPLEDAVSEFNLRASNDRTGNDQPPLTVEEVTKAIQEWDRDKRPPVSDEMFDSFQEIARTKRLPEGAKFGFTTSATTPNRSKRVWWIDICIMNADGSGYTYRIRATAIGKKEGHDS